MNLLTQQLISIRETVCSQQEQPRRIQQYQQPSPQPSPQQQQQQRQQQLPQQHQQQLPATSQPACVHQHLAELTTPPISELLGNDLSSIRGDLEADDSGLNRGTSRSSFNNSGRAASIITSWGLNFNGSSKGMPAERFISMVNAYTNDCLNGNFRLLSENCHLLFSEKARDWFWRYRDSVTKIEWGKLCKALKEHYVGHLDDYDIKELMKERKQQSTESFEDFYNAIMHLKDRLKMQIDEKEVMEIMRRNLKPYLRKELFYHKIKNLAHLRSLVLKRELLNHDLDKRKEDRFTRKYVNEINNFESEEDSEEEISEVEMRKRREMICWNCRKEGHRYMDCLKEKTVFCYGCGMQNQYRPTCEKCSKNQKHTSNPKN
jgi:hypothetical protein